MRKLATIGLTIILGIAFLASVTPAVAADYTWTNSAGGSFGTAGNWNPAGPPGSADTAIFNQGSGTRATITFPAGTTTNAGLKLYKNNADNKYEFSIANGGTASTYDAGATLVCDAYQDRADVLVSTGTLVSSSVVLKGYDSIAQIVLDGPGTTWRITDNFDSYQTTLDLYVQNGATLEAQGGAGSSHDLWTENLDAAGLSRVQHIRVTGAGSSMTFTNLNTSFKVKGESWLEVLDGAVATFDDLGVENTSATYSNVYVVVSNATMNTKDLSFGGGSTFGHLNILDGATVHSAGDAQIDGYAVKYAIATVDNATWTYTGLLRMGWFGQTTLIVTNGGTVVGTNTYMYFPGIANNAYTNRIIVTGAGSVMKTKSMFPGGYSGNDRTAVGILSVNDSGTLQQVDAAANRFVVWTKGQVQLDGGTIENASAIDVKGTLAGQGSITGSVTVTHANAMVQPGNSVGQLNIGGTYSQSLGALAIEINGTTPGSGYDVLSVTGNVSFTGGTIDISQAAGFTPPGGSTDYDVVTSGGTVSTNGVTINLPSGGDGTWSVAVVSTAPGEALRVTSVNNPKGTVISIR